MSTSSTIFTGPPISFWAPPSGRWQLAAWGGFALLGVPGALAWFSEPLSSGRFLIALGLIGIFIAYGIATWRKIRLTSDHPAVTISARGLVFWPGSSREQGLSWQELKGVSYSSGGGESWYSFDTVDNRLLGSRVFFFIPIAIHVPAKARSREGARLDVWAEEYSIKGSEITIPVD